MANDINDNTNQKITEIQSKLITTNCRIDDALKFSQLSTKTIFQLILIISIIGGVGLILSIISIILILTRT